jgi:UDP-glucose 4-epimerase
MQARDRSQIMRGVRGVVTGGAGSIGSHVVNRLVGAGAEVLVVDNLSAGDPTNLTPSATLDAVDVRSCAARRAIARFRPHVVVHLAAQVGVATAARNPLFDADVNLRGTLNVLEAATEIGARVVVASSCAVYGAADDTALPVAECHPIAPTTPYGMSKAAALGYVGWFARNHSLSATSLILANVYGPGQRGGVVPAFVEAGLSGSPALIRGDGHQTRDFVHIADVAEAFVTACAAPPAGKVNIGSGTATSVRELHNLMAEIGNVRALARHDAPQAGDVRRMRLAIERARQRLSWRPRITLSDGVRCLLHGSTVEAVAP